MMPGTDPITVYQGEDVTLNFTMSPLEDVTGWTLLFTVETDPETPKLIAVAGAITDGPNGKMAVTLDDTTSGTDQTPGSYTYDLWRTDTDSERVLAHGDFHVKDSARFPV
jgi:hypothetical protein